MTWKLRKTHFCFILTTSIIFKRVILVVIFKNVKNVTGDPDTALLREPLGLKTAKSLKKN